MNLYDTKNVQYKDFITAEFLYRETKDRFGMQLCNKPKHLKNKISDQNLHRPGLALSGFIEVFSFNRIQIFGKTENTFLAKLSAEERKNSLEQLFQFEIPCIICSNGATPFPELIELADKKSVPVFSTKLSTTKLSYLIGDFLDDQFSPRVTIHGSFVDVYGAGMMFVGKSGIGKSEVALDLVERGHRLVADDVVILTKKGEEILMGAGTKIAEHFMEIRGIGIVDVRSMFGIRAIRFQKRLEVVIELEIWDEKSHYTRTGLEDKFVDIMDVKVPYIKIPIIPGKNITVISEVIALNYLLKHYGYDAAKVFNKRLEEKIKQKSQEINRSIDYFEHDFE